MSRVNLHSLQILASLAITRSFTKTAAEMDMTPSAVSKRIAELEYRFKTPLVSRNSAGAVLTGAGEIVVRYTDQIIDLTSQMATDVAELIQKQGGEIRVMSNTTAILLGLLDDVRSFQRLHPDVRVSISEASSSETISAVRSNTIDIGVCVRSDAMSGLSTLPYRQTDLVVISARHHPLVGRSVVRAEDVRQYPIAWKPPISWEGNQAQDDLSDSVSLTARTFDAVIHAVRDGQGVALVPLIAVTEALPDDVALMVIDSPTPLFELALCHDPSLHGNPSVNQLLNWLHACSRSDRSGGRRWHDLPDGDVAPG